MEIMHLRGTGFAKGGTGGRTTSVEAYGKRVEGIGVERKPTRTDACSYKKNEVHVWGSGYWFGQTRVKTMFTSWESAPGVKKNKTFSSREKFSPAPREILKAVTYSRGFRIMEIRDEGGSTVGSRTWSWHREGFGQ